MNASQYQSRLTLAESLNKPIGGVFRSFSVIASAVTVTKRNDIGRNGSGAIGRTQRYPVIHGQRVKKSTWPVTYRTPIIEVVKPTVPISLCKRILQMAFTRLASLRFNAYLIFILDAVSVIVRLVLVNMSYSALPDAFERLLFVSFSVSLNRCGTFIAVFLMPLPIERPLFIGTFGIYFALLSGNINPMLIVILLLLYLAAMATTWIVTILMDLAFTEFVKEAVLLTRGATLEDGWQVKHNDLTFVNSPLGVGKRCEFPSFGCTALADTTDCTAWNISTPQTEV